MTNATYTDYPFTAGGINFVSRIAKNSPNVFAISRLSKEDFAQLNVEALTEIIGDVSLLTRDELVEELERINEGATHSWLLLGENA